MGWWRREERAAQGQRFGIGLALALALLSGVSMLRGLMERTETLALASAILLALALLTPRLLAPPSWALEELFKLFTKFLMYFLLVLVFYLIFSPAGIILRVLRKDPLLQKIDPHLKTYWMERKPKDPKRAEKQF